jgi:adenine-specific DNA-methyltransferase
MGARYPYYLLADSPEGQRKEGEVTRTPPKTVATRGDIRHGFVYDRVPHITLKSVANNVEIDVILEKWQETLEALRTQLNAALAKAWEEWEIPREAGVPWPARAAQTWADLRAIKDRPADAAVLLLQLNQQLGRNYTACTIPQSPRDPWPEEPTRLHAAWWEARIARQKDIDASIAAKAEFEYLYDKPYPDNSRVRVAGPLTVESLSPHRTLAVDWNDELVDLLEAAEGKRQAQDRDEAVADFAQMILENLKVAGVQQAHKEDRITFTSLAGWPGRFICAEGTFMEGENQKRAGIFIGPV